MDDLILKWFPLIFGFGVLAAFGWVIVAGTVQYLQQRRKQKEIDSKPRGHFVFARIIDGVAPMERGAKYENPLHDALQKRSLGIVTGGGSQMSRDGSSIEWIGIDIELSDLKSGLIFTCKHLRELGAPPGSVLEYRIGDQKKIIQIA